MNQAKTLLTNRKTLVLVTLFCLGETFWLWTSISRDIRHGTGTTVALFAPAIIFVVASIAYRSQFWADRVVFGAMAIVAMLTAIRALPSSSATLLVLDIARASMWTVALSTCLIALVMNLIAGGTLDSDHQK